MKDPNVLCLLFPLCINEFLFRIRASMFLEYFIHKIFKIILFMKNLVTTQNKPASEVVICACNLGIDREAFKLFEIYTSC